MLDPDYEDLLPLLSVPAAQHDPGLAGVTRRRFLQATLATTGAAALSGTRWAKEAFGSPIAASDGVLVMVMLGGGNDGLNAFAPISGTDRSRYQTLRGGLAIPAAQLLPAAEGYGFHPRLTKLRARYATGRVAVVRGVGQPTNDLSHFTSMATFMAGTASTARSSGWLGRYLDGVTEFDSGMRGITFSSSVPLHLLGQRAKVTAVPDQGGMWGSDPTEAWERAAFAAVQAYGDAPTGLSAWGDRVAANGKAAIGMAQTINTLYQPDLTATGLVRDLTLAARLINANLGTRVIGVSVGGWDTHSNQLYDQGELLGELDAGIEAFFTTLAAGFRDQTTLATFSEFGRRPEANDSVGTDHGTASVMFVVGENVRGGLHGAQPSLTTFDQRANFVPTVDFRSVYATLLDRWLDGDPAALLGGTFEQLDLFTNVPGGPRTPPGPPPPPNPAKPFPDWTALVRQQYVDLLITNPAATSVATWVGRLQRGETTPVDMIVAFIGSTGSVQQVQPVLRAHWACFGRVPTYDQLAYWVGLCRSSGIAKVCDAMVATASFRARNGTLDNTAYAKWLYRATLGRTATTSQHTHWAGQLSARRTTRGGAMATFLALPDSVAYLRSESLACMFFACMIRRVPSTASLSTWISRFDTGTTLPSAVSQFFAAPDYAARFG